MTSSARRTNGVRTYPSQIGGFYLWCADSHVTPCSASVNQITDFLMYLSINQKLSVSNHRYPLRFFRRCHHRSLWHHNRFYPGYGESKTRYPEAPSFMEHKMSTWGIACLSLFLISSVRHLTYKSIALVTESSARRRSPALNCSGSPTWGQHGQRLKIFEIK